MGDSYDNNMIAVIAYLGHQMSVSKLQSSSSVINELSLTPRNITSLQITENIVQTIIQEEPKKWSEFLETVDYPRDYMITFSALVATTFSLLLPSWINTPMIKFLATHLTPPESSDFIINHYLPELEEATKDQAGLSLGNKISLYRKFMGMIVKILYAFLF